MWPKCTVSSGTSHYLWLSNQDSVTLPTPLKKLRHSLWYIDQVNSNNYVKIGQQTLGRKL